MNEQIAQVSRKNITVFHVVVTLLPILFVMMGVGFSYASGVDQNTKDVVQVKKDVKELSEVRVDINTLNVTTATLKSEVNHIKESQTRTENQIRETNELLRELIQQTKEQKYQPLYREQNRDPEYLDFQRRSRHRQYYRNY